MLAYRNTDQIESKTKSGNAEISLSLCYIDLLPLIFKDYLEGDISKAEVTDDVLDMNAEDFVHTDMSDKNAEIKPALELGDLKTLIAECRETCERSAASCRNLSLIDPFCGSMPKSFQ